MNRREFLQVCKMLGIALPLQPFLSACGGSASAGGSDGFGDFSGSVLIVGAGAAGLTAGYLLQQLGIDFQILEASSQYGGRTKQNAEFVDFPVPLGAEWIHVNPNILNEIVNDSSVSVDIQTTQYDPATDFGLHEGEQIPLDQVGFDEDSKFINSTWFDFFDRYVAPSVDSLITYNAVVESIDYSGEVVRVSTATNVYTADRVIVAVPVKMLQNNAIVFNPSLPNNKMSAISSVKVWDGCKAFIEFSEKFYPTFVSFEISPPSDGQKLYYDASYGQPTSRHVLGLFAVGTGTLPYVQLSDSDLIAYMLDELDALFSGQASSNYVSHIFQNWNTEPFANGAYVFDGEDWRRVRTLGDSVSGRVFFAGDAYTDGEDWSSVHTAARSARTAVQAISNS